MTQQTKKVFISFDIETVVSKFSKNFDYKVTILQGALEIAKLLEEKKIKATFFISLSPKAKNKDIYKYLSEKGIDILYHPKTSDNFLKFLI